MVTATQLKNIETVLINCVDSKTEEIYEQHNSVDTQLKILNSTMLGVIKSISSIIESSDVDTEIKTVLTNFESFSNKMAIIEDAAKIVKSKIPLDPLNIDTDIEIDNIVGTILDCKEIDVVNSIDKKIYSNLPKAKITKDLNPLKPVWEYSFVSDVRNEGEHGGTSREGRWNVRAINTIVEDSFNNVSLVKDDFVLKKGTYRIRVIAPAASVKKHCLRVFNETTSKVEFEGYVVEDTTAEAIGIIHSNGTDLFEIQHYTEKKKKKYGLGKAMDKNVRKTSEYKYNKPTEVYTTLEIYKVV